MWVNFTAIYEVVMIKYYRIKKYQYRLILVNIVCIVLKILVSPITIIAPQLKHSQKGKTQFC